MTNQVNISDYTLFADPKIHNRLISNSYEKVFTRYSNTHWSGETAITKPTLAAFTNFVSTKDGVKLFAHYKTEIKGKKRKDDKVQKEGYIEYDINMEKNIKINVINDYKFSINNKGTLSNAFHLMQNNDFIYVYKNSKENTIVEKSNAKEKVFNEKIDISEAFYSYMSNERREKSNSISEIYLADGKYFGINYKGGDNPYGDYKKVNIFINK